MASFVLSFFPLDVLDEIWDVIESVSEGFPTYSYIPRKTNEAYHKVIMSKDLTLQQREERREVLKARKQQKKTFSKSFSTGCGSGKKQW